jgi:hypothetical protein
MLFNWLSGKIQKYEAGLANAGSELVDQLEAGAIGGGVSGDVEPLPRIEEHAAAMLAE